MVMIKPKYILIDIVALFYGKEIKIRIFLVALFFCFIILRLILLGSLIFEGASRSPATSVMELFPTLVNNFLLITNVARTSVLNVAGAINLPLLLKLLELHLLLKISFFRAIFLKVLVSEFALIIGLLWPCTFNTAYTLLFNENLYMFLIISYNGIFFKTCLSTFILELSWEKYNVTLYKHM